MQTTFSPTELQSILNCGKKYELETEVFPKPHPTITHFAAIRGTFFHQAVAEGLHDRTALEFLWNDLITRHKKLGGVILLEDNLKFDVMFQQVNEYWDYMTEHRIETIEREKPLEFSLAGGVKIKTGGLDFIGQHPDTPKGAVEIHDYKTGLKPSVASLNRNLQFGLYYLAAKRNGYQVNNLWWGHTQDLVRIKSGARKGQRKGQFLYQVQIGKQDEQLIIDMAHEAIKLHQSGARPWSGARQSNDLCDMCPFKDNGCPAFTVGLTKPPAHNLAMAEHEKMFHAALQERKQHK